MAAATEVTHVNLLKRLYPEDRVEKAMYDNNPLFAMLPKKYEFVGESMHRALRIAHTAGRSADFGKAKQNKKGSEVVKLLITVVRDYSLYSVAGLLIALSANSKGALVNAFEEEIEAAMDAMNRSFGWGVYGNGGGAIATISSATTIASTTLKLASADDIVKFEKNQVLEYSLNDGTSGSLRTGQSIVTAITRDDSAPTITVDAVLNVAVPAIATGDFIFCSGDFGAKMSGLDAWVPKSAPSATAFFGLDRTSDTVRLAGTRVSGSGFSVSEAVKRGLQQVRRNAGRTSHIFMNDKRFLDLELELQSAKRYIDTEVAGVGFSGVEFTSGGRKVEAYGDINCPPNAIYFLQMDTWSVEGPKKFPQLDAFDGNKILREEAADAYEGRVISYHQMICKAPGRNGRTDLDV